MNSKRNRYLVAAGALLLLLICGLTGWYMLRAMRRTAAEAVKTVFVPQEKTLDLAAFVTQVRDLNRLETASMRVMHVGTVTQTYKMVPNALAGDELQFLATGDVIAGVDLAQLKREDVWREPDGTIVMRLPPAQILVSRVDNKESRVLSRKTGVLRRHDPDLESRARQHAEQQIRNEAVKRGIIPLAQTNAEKRLADLVHLVGAEKVRFVTPAPSPGAR
ncbi:MAG TPA: DUF4230 domain-containing protein [Thermoanaerobaculia bacterium]|jgi:hypothetical protein